MVSERKGNAGSQADERAVSADDDSPPVFMYVHYLTHGSEEPYPLYLFQLEGPESPDDHLKRAIDDIIEGAVKEVPSDPTGQLHWRVFSYTAFVLNGDPRITEVTFKHEGDNHSFDVVDSIADYRGCSAVYYINKRLRRSPRRRLRKGESEYFEWTAHHPHAVRASPDDIINHESSTTNTGP